MVFHNGGAADTTEETLLHSAFETDDSYLGRWLDAGVSSSRIACEFAYQLNVDIHLSHTDPRKGDATLPSTREVREKKKKTRTRMSSRKCTRSLDVVSVSRHSGSRCESMDYMYLPK